MGRGVTGLTAPSYQDAVRVYRPDRGAITGRLLYFPRSRTGTAKVMLGSGAVISCRPDAVDLVVDR